MIPEKCYVLVNAHSCQGNGLKKWNSIREEVFKRLPGVIEIIPENLDDMKKRLTELLSSQEKSCIISAGGDGSMHELCNILLHSGKADNHLIGAVGLGSSNDFLKPFHTFIRDVPVRINRDEPYQLQDVGMVRYLDENNIWKVQYFIINASFGVTAEGNWIFNEPNTLLKWLKKTNTGLAITYAAVSSILGYRNKKVTFDYDDIQKTEFISNINILKTPYVSGSLCYHQDIHPDDGQLRLNICLNMNKVTLLYTLFKLEKGVFVPDAKKLSTMVTQFDLKSNVPVIFECDGETEKVYQVEISVIPKALCVLKS
ncbi:MAG TPA: diacylglycerol kinase family protein [Paludibacter sp.]|nr:diacylglycerol kinase family protein [Paludibacter sp.]